MTTVFVIGNGISRKGFDLNQLVGKGKIVICNEAYRDFVGFDAIASVDGNSTLDIRQNVDLKKVEHIHKWKNNWYLSTKDMGQLVGSYNSGQLALRGAIELYRPTLVYLLGIDYGGKRLYTGKVAGEPSNKCWDTWNVLAAQVPTLIRVPQDISWEEVALREDLLIR